jgi:rhodanese-related sulfurtransferase
MSGVDLAAIQIGPSEARALLDERGPDGVLLLDVRQPAEYEEFHLPGARLVPLPDLETRWRELDPATPVLAYCHVGSRSLAAAHFLRRRGFASASTSSPRGPPRRRPPRRRWLSSPVSGRSTRSSRRA